MPVGDVTRHLGDTKEPSFFVHDAIEYRARPEATPVFAHAPALGLGPPLRSGARYQLLRYPSRTIGIGVENLEVSADDLIGPVAGDLLSALVPAAHPSVRIEHQNRVVRDAVEQDLKPPFVILAGRECRCFWHRRIAAPRARDGRLGRLHEMRSRRICCRPSDPPTAKGTRNARHLD